MPVVGQRYIVSPQFSVTSYVVEVIAITDKWIAVKTNKYFSFDNEIIESFLLDGWQESLKELPTSNSREKEEVRVGNIYKHLENGADYKLAGIDSGDHAICIKLDEKGNAIIPTINEIPTVDKFWLMFAKNDKGNKNPNPVDFEKEEVSEVERALKDLKAILMKATLSNIYYHEQYKEMKVLAENLVNALEAEKKIRRCDHCGNRLGTIACKSSFKLGNFCSAKCADFDALKPEPKIDMKEECVEPASIWKPISQLNKNENNDLLVRRSNKKIFLGEHLVGVLYDYNNDYDFCTLTDFINSFEQMQKDIAELKRK